MRSFWIYPMINIGSCSRRKLIYSIFLLARQQLSYSAFYINDNDLLNINSRDLGIYCILCREFYITSSAHFIAHIPSLASLEMWGADYFSLYVILLFYFILNFIVFKLLFGYFGGSVAEVELNLVSFSLMVWLSN